MIYPHIFHVEDIMPYFIHYCLTKTTHLDDGNLSIGIVQQVAAPLYRLKGGGLLATHGF